MIDERDWKSNNDIKKKKVRVLSDTNMLGWLSVKWWNNHLVPKAHR